MEVCECLAGKTKSVNIVVESLDGKGKCYHCFNQRAESFGFRIPISVKVEEYYLRRDCAPIYAMVSTITPFKRGALFTRCKLERDELG